MLHQTFACTLRPAAPSLAAYAASPDELRWLGYPIEGARAAPSADPRPPRVLGLDAEMVHTIAGRELAWLALVELVDAETGAPLAWPSQRPWRAQTLIDIYVRPEGAVLDYLTPYSGITPEDLEGVTLTREGALEALLEHLRPQDLLCGHGLDNDLQVLGLAHAQILDTALLYPHHEGPPMRQSLSALALDHLGRRIQQGRHSPTEDALAALELAKRKLDAGLPRLVWWPIPGGAPAPTPDLTLEEALRRLELDEARVLCVYLRGSRAVGYAGQRDDGSPSDWDLVVVLEEGEGPSMDSVHISHGDVDAALYSEGVFRGLVERCTIWALECLFAPPEARWRERIDYRAVFARYKEEIPPDLFSARLRQSVMYEAGRQWSKAKRDLEKRGSRYQCRKRLFIALRFLTYGLEIAEHGVIPDVSCANLLWSDQIRDDPGRTWPEFKARYGPIYEDLKARFQRAAPQAPRYGGFEAPQRRGDDQIEARAAFNHACPAQTTPPRWEESPLEAQRLLRAAATPAEGLAELGRRFKIGIRYHARTPGIVQLRYSPASEPRDHPIVAECRGLILDARRGWALLAEPLRRFFNLKESEGRATPLDWATARVFDKLDGSLAILYAEGGAWRVASSRRPDASSTMCPRDPDGGVPFEALFWRIWAARGYALPPLDGPRRCYLFEMTTPKHAVVVRYPDERLRLIAARDLITHEELEPGAIAAARGWEAAAEALRLEGIPVEGRAAFVEAAAEGLDASRAEGYVVRDAAWRRVKVKSSEYSRRAWLFPMCPQKQQMGTRHLLRVLLSGEQREFIAYCPDYAPALRAVEARLEALHAELEAAYAALDEIEDAKGFALAVKGLRFPASAAAGVKTRSRMLQGALLRMRHAGASAEVILRGLRPKKVERMLGDTTGTGSRS